MRFLASTLAANFLLLLLNFWLAFNSIPFVRANESTEVTTEDSKVTTTLATTAEETSLPTQTTAGTTVTQAVTDSTTSLPSTTTAPPRPTLLVTPSERCPCDLTANSCDVNCCCDGECSADDSRAFQFCADKARHEPDLRYCTKRDLVFANRTLFEKRPVGDLLCVVIDNVKKKDVYPDPPMITTLAEAHGLLKDRVSHEWTPTSRPRLQLQDAFKAGSTLLRVDDQGTAEEWRLPTKVFSARCDATEAVIYLRDIQLECRRRVGTLEQSCSSRPELSAASYHSGFAIRSSPDEKAKVEAFVCSEGSCVGANATDTAPRYVDGACVHVVSDVSYRVFHNGADGIVRIEAYLKLETVRPARTEFSQKFSVSFAWASSKEAETLKVSGNPGYLSGLPVLAGCFNQNGSACGRGEHSELYLTIPETEDGDCSSPIVRTKIKFRTNIRTGCLLRPSKFQNCSAVLETLLSYVTGISRYVTHVASFGNANRSLAADFVPILVENPPPVDSRATAAPSPTGSDVCLLPATHVRVRIMHAKTDHASEPQAKIVSVLRSYGGAAELRLSPSSSSRHRAPTEVTYIASFVDVTPPKPRRIFAPPPTIDARLPHDFFYPFFLESAAAAKCHGRASLLFCALSFVVGVVAFWRLFPLLEHC